MLEDLAYYMLRNDWSVVTEKQARARLSLKLEAMQNLPDGASAETALGFFVERSGMLRQPSSGKLDFAYRTFQEFLAAQAAVDEGDFGELRKNATNTQWREVIILAAGLARPKERNELLTNLIKDGDAHKKQGPALHLLAASCQQTAVDLAPAVRKEIEKRLKKHLPPARVRDAERLADAAGGALIPFLQYSKKLNAKQAKAGVRALARIGSPEALEAMSGYVQDRRPVVRKELFRALGSFG